MKTLDMLHELEKHKCVYNIHYCRAGIGFCFWMESETENWRDGLYTDKYYPTFEEAVQAEYDKMLKEGLS